MAELPARGPPNETPRSKAAHARPEPSSVQNGLDLSASRVTVTAGHPHITAAQRASRSWFTVLSWTGNRQSSMTVGRPSVHDSACRINGSRRKRSPRRRQRASYEGAVAPLSSRKADVDSPHPTEARRAVFVQQAGLCKTVRCRECRHLPPIAICNGTGQPRPVPVRPWHASCPSRGSPIVAPMVAGEGVTGGNCAKHPQLCGRAGRCWPAYRAAGDEIEDSASRACQDYHVLRRLQPRRDNDRGSGRPLIPAPGHRSQGRPADGRQTQSRYPQVAGTATAAAHRTPGAQEHRPRHPAGLQASYWPRRRHARIPWLGPCHRAEGKKLPWHTNAASSQTGTGLQTSTPPEPSTFTRASASACDPHICLIS